MSTVLFVKNPATGEILAELQRTPLELLPQLFSQAKTAQSQWAALTLAQRAAHLFRLRETLLNHLDETAALISKENGKPLFESLASELLPALELITFFATQGPQILKDRSIRMRVLKHRKSSLNYWPLGVVTVISPWNYPFSIAWGDIIMALIAGNAVVFKPSEITPLIGLKIQTLCEEAGLPMGLVQTVIGDGAAGAAIIQNKPAKIFFTGSVSTGKKIMAAASAQLIPVSLELGGKDPILVFPDADLDLATSAALWGAFTNSGQVCASIERAIVHESIAAQFTELLKEKTLKLRPGVDLGCITFENQKSVYEQQLAEVKVQNQTLITGGQFSADKRSLEPTLVTGSKIESLQIFTEETFGPTLAITTFKTTQEAVAKANHSRYGLLASVFTKDLQFADQIARQIEAGSVLINEVTYTGGVAGTPWGGVKDSGFGRTHSADALLEFVNVRHIHTQKFGFISFKSLWWFPYTFHQFQVFRHFTELYRSSWIAKFKGLSHLLWNLVQMLKHEKRI